MSTTVLVITIAASVLTLLAELLHQRRIGRVRFLSFGPKGRPAAWTALVPLLRAVAAAGVAWGAGTLLWDVEPRSHASDTELEEGEWKHLVLVLDVSPSMRLEDAGPDLVQARRGRARDVIESMFGRVAIGQFKISVIATYTGAAPVIEETRDAEVVRNVLGDLPLEWAFKSGETRLFSGLEAAMELAKPWPKDSTTIVVISDGDTIPPTGMPRVPPSVTGTLVIGVGDPVKGKFIGGKNSRQDVSALRQMALRLGGTYHNGNQRHVATEDLRAVTSGGDRSALEKLTRREYALIALGAGTALLALLPLLLQFLGSRWAAARPTTAVPRAAA